MQEKLAAQHKEQDDSLHHIRYGSGDLHGNLNVSAPLQQYGESDAYKEHRNGVQPGEPRGDDGGKPITAGQAGSQGLLHCRCLDHARQAAEPSGDKHGHYDNRRNVHSGIPGRFLAFAHYRNLKPFFSMVDENIYEYDEYEGDYPADMNSKSLGRMALSGKLLPWEILEIPDPSKVRTADK